MLTLAMRTTAVLLGFLNLTDIRYAMFSFAMTSALTSDSEFLISLNFKIIITLRQAQILEIRVTGPYKYFDFLYNPLVPKFFRNFY